MHKQITNLEREKSFCWYTELGLPIYSKYVGILKIIIKYCITLSCSAHLESKKPSK